MAIELKFHKTDNTPWGFRLTGGADCDIPLTVIKVVGDSIADRSGLQVSDVVVRINDKPTANCTHAEAHELILEDEDDLIFAVRRNDVTLMDLNNLAWAYESRRFVSFQPLILHVNWQVMEEQRKDDEMELKERQWSSFLQKPQRPIIIPKPKRIEQSKAPAYQVIIKKQKRKNDAIIDTLTVSLLGILIVNSMVREILQDTQTDAIPEDVTREESPQTVNIASESDDLDECRDLENVEYIEQLDESAQNIDEEGDEGNNKNDDEVATEIEEEEEEVEDQLIQVQMQLEALAQLPSSIQDTLDAVTKQLCKILNATTSRTEEVCSGIQEENNIDITQKEDNFEPTDSLDISERGSNFNDEDNTEVEIISNEYEYDHDLEEEINEEEQSHQRRLEQRPTNPLAPVQRPIILPGGRRWSQPDDALPTRKKKSGMSDEKICETLDLYSETIVGHTMGINFLKYQPPPKNLDYLQKSEVYKLIHDMEPPARGIATRPGRVASEQDYYEKVRY
ncbi:hypothetical protein RI129_004609 [Pyrocoelia pectoralis]|uniref:PDZ domain-containing protein n=1 Tax=Pyrocoelia pectoralis TaxID=417401 RepID=A0AAN7ZGW3_9COLE